MVYSNINTAIFYKESKNVDPEDEGYASPLYEMDLLNKTVLVTLGKVKHTFTERNVVFYPIYLVDNHQNTYGQIGIIEIKKNELIDILDDDGDIDVEKVKEVPLIYDYVNESVIDRSGSDAAVFLRKLEKEKTKDKKEEEKDDKKEDKDQDKQKEEKDKKEEKDDKNKDDEDDEAIKSDDDDDEVAKVKVPMSKISVETTNTNVTLKDGVFHYDESVKHPPSLPEETEHDANVYKKEFKASNRNTWIETFMKNNHYDIHSVESNGDCFFAVVRDAYKQIGQITTVAKLRALVAKEATDSIFHEYRKLYLDLTNEIKDIEQEMKSAKHTLEKVLKKRATEAREKPSELAEIMKQMEELKLRFRKLQKDRKQSQELIEESVGHFETIDTLDKFREYIQTSQFWADAWSISVLERILQMKVIILSERSYLEGNVDGALDCGISDKDIQKAGIFAPKYYIMTTFSGNHYQLVTYKDKRIFEFQEIPYRVKGLIINKCMERNSGIFYMIQDFRNLKARMGLNEDEGKPREEGEEDEEEKKGEGESESKKRVEYDPAIVFQFGATQPLSAKPGMASNEKIPKDKRPLFTKLSQFPEWRRRLDDDWTQSPFTLDGHRWASVEHYYQAAKFKKQNPDFMLQFSLDTESSEIAKDVELARAAGSRSGKATGKAKSKVKGDDVLLRPKSIIPDADFEGVRSQRERITAVLSKFSQNEDLKRMLLATRDAKLVRFIRRDEAEPDYILMNVRKELL